MVIFAKALRGFVFEKAATRLFILALPNPDSGFPHKFPSPEVYLQYIFRRNAWNVESDGFSEIRAMNSRRNQPVYVVVIVGIYFLVDFAAHPANSLDSVLHIRPPASV